VVIVDGGGQVHLGLLTFFLFRVFVPDALAAVTTTLLD
jgi:hypothetical protein